MRASFVSRSGVVRLFPCLGPLQADLVMVQELPQPLAAHGHALAAVVEGEVVAEFAQAPPGEWLIEYLGSGSGRRDDERFIVVTDPAGTATRPMRVQAGQPHLIEPVDHLPDRVFVALDQPSDRGDRVSTGGGHDDHGPS